MYKINFQKKAKNIDNCRIIHKEVLLKREKMKWRNKCMKKVYGLIRRLGANSKYKGYFFVAEAVKISMGDQYKPLRITKDIYPYLARKYRSTPTNIEHDIRTMVNVCWEGNKKLLDEIAGYPLEYKPTNSEFIDMLAYYLREIEEEN